MATTHDNLKEAFAGESQAFQKYTAFAKKAEQDGFASIAKLFRLTAQAERIHAEGHLKALDGVGSTAGAGPLLFLPRRRSNNPMARANASPPQWRNFSRNRPASTVRRPSRH